MEQKRLTCVCTCSTSTRKWTVRVDEEKTESGQSGPNPRNGTGRSRTARRATNALRLQQFCFGGRLLFLVPRRRRRRRRWWRRRRSTREVEAPSIGRDRLPSRPRTSYHRSLFFRCPMRHLDVEDDHDRSDSFTRSLLLLRTPTHLLLLLLVGRFVPRYTKAHMYHTFSLRYIYLSFALSFTHPPYPHTNIHFLYNTHLSHFLQNT